MKTRTFLAARCCVVVLGCLTALGCLSTLGCDDANYDPPTLIKTMRVLAVRADPPYIGLAPTRVSAFVVGQTPGETLCYAWALCPFAWEEDGNYACLDPSLQVDLGNAPTANANLLALLTVLEKLPAVLAAKGLQPPKDVAVDGATDKPSDVAVDAGFEVRLLFQISEARIWGGTCPNDTTKMLAKPCPTRDGCMFGDKGLRVVVPNDKGAPSKDVHANPRLELLTLNGVPWPADVTPTVAVYKAPPADDLTQLNTTQGLEVRPVWSPGSIELISKSTEAGVPDTTERLIFSFFSDAGTFQYRRTGFQVPDNGYQAERPAKKAATQLVTLWVVVRDGRGGSDWTTRQLLVDPTTPAGRHPLCGDDPSLPKCDEVGP